jgi:hypothetical protein
MSSTKTGSSARCAVVLWFGDGGNACNYREGEWRNLAVEFLGHLLSFLRVSSSRG